VTYSALLATIDRWFADGVERAGPGVVLCRRGCSACCHGPFDISPADAELVANAVRGLEPRLQRELQRRAGEHVAHYRARVDWDAPWDVDALGDEAFDALAEDLEPLPCPALGDDGACRIYDGRPATCRMIGLPIVAASGDVIPNPCPIINTSPRYAALEPVPFDLEAFETAADRCDAEASSRGWVSTTVAGAIMRTPTSEEAVP
jgi:Fe-S-cluster containining protein